MDQTDSLQPSPSSLPPVGPQQSPAPVQPLPPIPLMPFPAQPGPSTALNAGTPAEPVAVNVATNISIPSAATDSDLIEKEWVERAKGIVKSTVDNPYEQSRQLTALKAEYMKMRYDKDVKQSE